MPIKGKTRQGAVSAKGELEWINREGRPLVSQLTDHVNAEAIPPTLTRIPPSTVSPALAIDFQRYRSFLHRLNGDLTEVTFTVPDNSGDYRLVVTQEGAFTITGWPSNVIWPGGTAPTFTETLTYVHFYFDGTQWFGCVCAAPDTPGDRVLYVDKATHSMGASSPETVFSEYTVAAGTLGADHDILTIEAWGSVDVAGNDGSIVLYMGVPGDLVEALDLPFFPLIESADTGWRLTVTSVRVDPEGGETAAALVATFQCSSVTQLYHTSDVFSWDSDVLIQMAGRDPTYVEISNQIKQYGMVVRYERAP